MPRTQILLGLLLAATLAGCDAPSPSGISSLAGGKEPLAGAKTPVGKTATARGVVSHAYKFGHDYGDGHIAMLVVVGDLLAGGTQAYLTEDAVAGLNLTDAAALVGRTVEVTAPVTGNGSQSQTMTVATAAQIKVVETAADAIDVVDAFSPALLALTPHLVRLQGEVLDLYEWPGGSASLTLGEVGGLKVSVSVSSAAWTAIKAKGPDPKALAGRFVELVDSPRVDVDGYHLQINGVEQWHTLPLPELAPLDAFTANLAGLPRRTARVRGEVSYAYVFQDGGAVLTVGMNDGHKVGVWARPEAWKAVHQGKDAVLGRVVDLYASPQAEDDGAITLNLTSADQWRPVAEDPPEIDASEVLGALDRARIVHGTVSYAYRFPDGNVLLQLGQAGGKDVNLYPSAATYKALGLPDDVKAMVKRKVRLRTAATGTDPKYVTLALEGPDQWLQP